MTVRSKVSGAALAVAAPEAELPAAAATQAQRHRAQIDAIKAKRKPAPLPVAGSEPASPAPASSSPRGGRGLPSAFTDQRGAPDWYRKVASPDPVALANTGGGFLLGLGLWALGLAYLRGGPTEVRKLLAAKFFNKVS